MSPSSHEEIVPSVQYHDNVELEAEGLEKTHDEHNEITVATELAQATEKVQTEEGINDEMRQRLRQLYGYKVEQDGMVLATDVIFILDKISEMSEERAMEIVLDTIEHHAEDANFPSWTMDKIQQLSAGSKANSMDPLDWAFDLKAEAAMIYYHSPYPEVRAVTDPFDDPTIPVETLRAYFLGLVLMGGSTAINTFFSPRQPAISLSANVLQLILAPLGQASARFLPDWGFNFRGTRYSINPGPWTFKEQLFSTIMFSVANGAGGTYYTYLVQLLPQYLGQTWVTFGYEILLALYVQFAGFGFAGILRRFVIYPQTAIWPSILPTLALNRTLVQREQREIINGWHWTRYKFFLIMFVAQFIYFWIPNKFFTALHGFNWMTWIAPQNFNLGMITGFYGGMGFNPWATFDWNVSGTGALVTPFHSQIQQYIARVLSGIFITAAYYSNFVWAAYTPINSNETFDNKGNLYNVSRIMGDNGYVNVTAYKDYGPPYYSGANVFGQGNYLAWYALTLTYVVIRNWRALRNAAVQMWRSLRFGSSVYDGNDDAHTRMMRAYPEVPDWWFLIILVVSNALGIAALEAWPTHTPWWSLLAVMGINLIMLIPNAFLIAVANLHTSLGVLFKMLAGVWFAGNPVAMVIMQAVGPTFDAQTDTYMSDQKIAHYAKLPPRAIFRGQLLSVFCNCFIFIGMLNWMVNDYNDGTLCTWDNEEHFVCTSAVLVYASSVMYGAFGVRNLFKLYPIIPYGILLGAFTGCAFGFGQKYGRRFVQWAQVHWSGEKYAWWDKHLFTPLSPIYWFNPAVCWAGALTWTGGNNLSYATNAMYISFIFMYHIKRRYPAWWQKYNCILEAAFDIGVAVSGTIQTLAFGFSGVNFPKWWGNTIAQAGVDFESYNQKAPLLPIPEKGYFGLDPDQYPMEWPQDVIDGTKK